jgi:hypothetical protein
MGPRDVGVFLVPTIGQRISQPPFAAFNTELSAILEPTGEADDVALVVAFREYPASLAGIPSDTQPS